MTSTTQDGPHTFPNGASESERQQFEEHGFFVRHDVFSKQEIVTMRAGIEAVHAHVVEAADAEVESGEIVQVDNQKFQDVLGSTIKWEWKDDLRAVRSMEPTCHLDARLDGLIDDSRIWGPCASIIGTDQLSIFSDKLNVKRPGGAPFPWHQEGPYWAYGAEDLENVVTAMVCVDDATKENGCLWVIPGTHDQGPLKALEGRGTLGKLYTDVDLIDAEPWPAELSAGSVLWFHYNIVHGSQSNRTNVNRRLFLLAYQPAGLHRWNRDDVRDVAHG
jgi:phytanoyl-CoA hydroxylase